MSYRLSQGIIDSILEKRKQGITTSQIAKDLNIKECTVIYICNKNGVVLNKEQRSINRSIYSNDEIQNVVNLRKEGLTYLQIVEKTNISLSEIKRFLRGAGVRIGPEESQKRAYEAKLKKNPNAMEDMRESLTPEVIAKRSEAIRESYKDPNLIQLKSDQSKDWWNSLSESDKEEYLSHRDESINNSSKVKEYRDKLSEQKGCLNPKSIKCLKDNESENFSSLMDKYASKNEGKCVGKYIDIFTKIPWQCKNGHTFEMRPNNVQQGQWCPQCSNHTSKGQKEMFDYVKSLLPDVEVLLNDRKAICPKELDVYVPSLKVGIEYNGLYYHSSASPGYDRNGHFDKFKMCERAGIKLFAFFEDEWLNKQDLVKAMIRWRLGKFNGTKVNARDCNVARLDRNKDFSDFFNRNHLDGTAKASYAYGLFFEGKLIQCLSLRRNFNGETEIARLATDYDYSVRGGAARLLSQVEERPLTTFSNNRLSTGEVYKKNGFEYVKRNEQPSYWYTDGVTRVWRFKCKRINTPEILDKYPTEVSQATNGVFSQFIFGDNRPLFRVDDYSHKKWVIK